LRYWDSSALIPLLVEEPRSGALRSLAATDGSIAAWWGSPVECCSAIGRIRREGGLTIGEEDRIRRSLDALSESWTEIEPTADLRGLAARLLLNHPLRAADAMQLAAALVWSGPRVAGHEFVCLDERLRFAARNEGFNVLPESGGLRGPAGKS
jgi:predicted nucleic acid-binding protein